MNIDPAEYWSQATQDGTVERWSSYTRRKILLWRSAMLLARVMKRGLDIVGAIGALCAFSPIFAATALLMGNLAVPAAWGVLWLLRHGYVHF